jgi:hypothetical protein
MIEIPEMPEPPAELTQIAEEISCIMGIPFKEVAYNMMKLWKHITAAEPVRLTDVFKEEENRVNSDILEKVGELAALEQLAEECGELAMASLKLGHVVQKMARIERNENPTPKTFDECREELYEEIADVEVTIDVIRSNPWIQVERINHYYDKHMKRWHDRLGIEEDSDKID